MIGNIQYHENEWESWKAQGISHEISRMREFFTEGFVEFADQ